ncbi:SIR2 family protein [Candidatus Puniceispirillum marinum]|uniref:Uncharacterized protein n=1 Tax=Puniceispirillum marinum (strain IMCC1322) TaxID=488538 RepID=D5BMF0_PUNMI|nr:SIR2 family protein [Candidatus Puniceispirillum marinum]ADE39993.1 hypothetical protein SAR116_1750 [Candidatus Puniceispirillum marinum IMCC1322]
MTRVYNIDVTENECVKCLGDAISPYIQSGNINFLIGAGTSRPAINVLGNIEKTINKNLEAGEDEKANLEAFKFIRDMVAVDQSSGDTFETYVNFLKLLDDILFKRQTPLLPRQATIFSTNYDLFIEHACTIVPSLILNDGFDRNVPLGKPVPFTPEKYFDRVYRSSSVYGHSAEMPSINLCKLHGSLSWSIIENSVKLRQTAIELSSIKETDADGIRSALEQLALILPNLNKFNKTLLEGTYYDLLRIFANALDRENSVLLVLGFSFDDEHILNITKRALRNPTLKILIFAFNEDESKKYRKKFEAHRNVTIITPINKQKIKFKTFISILGAIMPHRGSDT